MKKHPGSFMMILVFMVGLPAIAQASVSLEIRNIISWNYLLAIAACVILLIILSLLLFLSSINLKRRMRELDQSIESFNRKIKEMPILKSHEDEIEEELEKEITDSQGKAQLLKLRIEELTEENERLEVLLARYQNKDMPEQTGSSESETIKQELIDQIEFILARLKQKN